MLANLIFESEGMLAMRGLMVLGTAKAGCEWRAKVTGRGVCACRVDGRNGANAVVAIGSGWWNVLPISPTLLQD
jgi:hypothetical protein